MRRTRSRGWPQRRSSDESQRHEPDRDARPLRERTCLRRHSARRRRRAEDLLLDWIGSALAGKGARAVETIERFARQMGPSDGAVRGADLAPSYVAAVRGAGQCRRLALRRAGRRAQRLGVPSGRRRVPAGARGRAGDWRIGARSPDRRRRRLRSRHPRRRVPGPLALQGVPYDRHRRHGRRRGRGRPLAETRSRRRCSTHSDPPGRRPRVSGSSCATPPIRSSCTRRRPRPTASSPRISRATVSPARCGFSRARRAWRRACRPTPIRRGSPTASANAGRSRRHRSSGTRRAATRIRPPMRCSPSSTSTISRPRDIARVTAFVHQAAIDVLGPVTDPATVHQAKFSMGTVLAMIARSSSRRAHRVRSAFPRS